VSSLSLSLLATLCAADYFSRHSYGNGLLSPFIYPPIIPFPVPMGGAAGAEEAAAGAAAGGADAAGGAAAGGADAAGGAAGAAAGGAAEMGAGAGAGPEAPPPPPPSGGDYGEPLERDLGGDEWFGDRDDEEVRRLRHLPAPESGVIIPAGGQVAVCRFVPAILVSWHADCNIGHTRALMAGVSGAGQLSLISLAWAASQGTVGPRPAACLACWCICSPIVLRGALPIQSLRFELSRSCRCTWAWLGAGRWRLWWRR
jgi:hypothetical protein